MITMSVPSPMYMGCSFIGIGDHSVPESALLDT